MKPNESGAIVRLNKLNWRGKPVIYAVPVGIEIPRKTLNWLKGFSKRSGNPLLYIKRSDGKIGSIQESISSQTAYGVGPPEFQQLVAEKRIDGFTVSTMGS